MPYKRNSDKNNLNCVFDDLGATCSTKHATLRKLALENNHSEVKLILGIFKMDADYTEKIKNTLEKFNLNHIPEAHNYLKIEDEYFDFTKPNSDYNLEEIWHIREQCIKGLQKNDDDEIQNSSSVCFANSLEVRDDYKV